MPWRAELDGHPFDLDILTEQFAGGDVVVVVEGDRCWLTSPFFDGLEAPVDVHEAAGRLLDPVNGIARLLDPAFRPVHLRGHYDDGSGVHAIVAGDVAVIRVRAHVGSVGVQAGGQEGVLPLPPPAPEGELYLSLAVVDEAVRDVAQLLGEAVAPDWATLYKVLEVIDEDSGDQIFQWVTKSELATFTMSANHPAISGTAARHARMSGTPRRSGMSIHEARDFIRGLAIHWIRDKLPEPTTPTDEAPSDPDTAV